MTCDSPIKDKDGLYGCGARLCRNMRHALTKMKVTRGETEGWICGFLTLLPLKSENYAVEGIRADPSRVHLTAVSSTFPVKAGDVIDTERGVFTVEMELDRFSMRYALTERKDQL